MMLKLLFYFLFFLTTLNVKAATSLKVGVLQIAKPIVLVYEQPSFDAQVIAKIRIGQKFYALKNKFTGLDGLGLFYKIRLKKKVFGYVLDTSVKGFKPNRASKIVDEHSRSKKKDKKRKGLESANQPIPYTKSLGPLVSQLNYSLKTGSGVKKSNLIFYGIRLTGPGWKYSKLPFDVYLLYSPSSPKFFDSLVEEHSGSVLLLDAGIPFELKKGSGWSIYGSLSAVVSSYNFDLIDNGKTENSSKTELGLSLGLGGGLNFGKYIFKAEGKYVKLGSDSLGVNFSFQRVF